MFRRILVAVDGSHHSKEAVERAAEIAKGCQAEVLGIVHVRPTAESWSLSHGYEVAAYLDLHQKVLEGLEANARRLLSEASERARERVGDTRIELHDEQGSVVPRIVEVVRREGYDLLVVGSRGMGRAAGLLLGSVSQSLLGHLPCSILVVRSEQEPPTGE